VVPHHRAYRENAGALPQDLILIRKSTVSRRAAASGRCPDPIRVALVVWWAGSGGGFEGDLLAEGLELADVVALGAQR